MTSANEICGAYAGGGFSGGAVTYSYVNARAEKDSLKPAPRCHPECFFRSETQKKMYRRRQRVATNTCIEHS